MMVNTCQHCKCDDIKYTTREATKNGKKYIIGRVECPKCSLATRMMIDDPTSRNILFEEWNKGIFDLFPYTPYVDPLADV